MDECTRRGLRPGMDKLMDHIGMMDADPSLRRPDLVDGMVLTIIESPFAGTSKDPDIKVVQQELNERYLLAAIADSLSRGEAPFASHGFYTRVLDDDDPVQRRQGMEAGFAWGRMAQRVAVYGDLGISPGMAEGIERAKAAGIPWEVRYLESTWAVIAD